jgi:hypothetical protein
MTVADNAMVVNIMVYLEDELYVAHCLELDLVATAETMDQVAKDMDDLIAAAVTYAFENDNLDHLYHPAPPEAWERLYACGITEERKIETKHDPAKTPHTFVPPWIIAKKCEPTRTSRS